MLIRLKNPNFPFDLSLAYKVPLEVIPKAKNGRCRQYRCLEAIASAGLYCGLRVDRPGAIEKHYLDVHVGRYLRCLLCHEQRVTYENAKQLYSHQGLKHLQVLETTKFQRVEKAIKEHCCVV